MSKNIHKVIDVLNSQWAPLWVSMPSREKGEKTAQDIHDATDFPTVAVALMDGSHIKCSLI